MQFFNNRNRTVVRVSDNPILLVVIAGTNHGPENNATVVGCREARANREHEDE